MSVAQNTKDYKIAEILLVEDNPQDVLLTRNAFKVLQIPYNITVASSGEEALKLLGDDANPLSRPALILLDLGLPGAEGIDVLKQLKNHVELKHIPVIILTGSLEENNIINSYDLKAHSYIVKPIDLTKQSVIEDLLKIRGYKPNYKG